MHTPKLPQSHRYSILVLMPTRGFVCAETLAALVGNCEGHHVILRTEDRQAVDVARNRLVLKAIAAAQSEQALRANPDPFVFWIDSDAYFIEGTLTMMMQQLERHPDIDVLVPNSGPRAPFAKTNNLLAGAVAAEPGVNCESGALVELEYASTHFMLHRLSLLTRLGLQPFGAEEEYSLAEDYYFSKMVRDAGGKIVMDTAIPVFHVDERNGNAFLPAAPTMKIVDNVVDVYGVHVTETPELAKRSYGSRVDIVKSHVELISQAEAARTAG